MTSNSEKWYFKRLPSVESQTIAFIEKVRQRQLARGSSDIKWDGFKVYLRYIRKGYLPPPNEDLEVIVIASIKVPMKYRQRSWFWRYCQLCLCLAKDGIVIECVLNEQLLKTLRRNPLFEEYIEGNFLLHKQHPSDWPLIVDWKESPHGPEFVGKPRHPNKAS